ncbi:MAG: hypothetical protein BMS9Abin18_0196 [Zetaproteobacteria bacterium]|nr:MAG: hypothetical protein BMS9Abin18_0196 [Zetaproteobacteria bacterium]
MNIRKYIFYSLPLGAAVLLGGQFAQAVEFKFSGEIRPRFEYANNALSSKAKDPLLNDTVSFTTTRTRLGVTAIVDSDTSGFIQIQDVRTWGGATPTTAPPSLTQTGTSVSASGLDIHQAYIDLKNILDTGLGLKIGRQELVFDEHRLIGNINWIQQGQTFDAVRGYYGLTDVLSVTAFIAKTLADATHPTLAATLAGNNNFESSFSGLRVNYSLGGKDRITPYLYHALNVSRTGKLTGNLFPNVAQRLDYVGAYILKHIDRFRIRLDGAYQFGNISTTVDSSAYMLTANISTNVDNIGKGANIMLWFDYLSGDDNPNDLTSNTFITPYATNHAYYGYMDNILNIPTQGLIDAAIKVWVKPTEKLKIKVDAHWFRSTESRVATPDKNLGQEIDVTGIYPLAKNTKLVLGYSHYFAGDPLSDNSLGSHTRQDGNWAYAMIDFKF